MVKLKSLSVQGPDMQAGDRAAPPGSPPLPLPGLWDQRERELVCPTGSDWSSECHIWRTSCPGPLTSRGPPGGGGAGASAGLGAGRAHSSAQWQQVSTATAATRGARTLGAHRVSASIFNSPAHTESCPVRQLPLHGRNPHGAFKPDQVLLLTALPRYKQGYRDIRGSRPVLAL